MSTTVVTQGSGAKGGGAGGGSSAQSGDPAAGRGDLNSKLPGVLPDEGHVEPTRLRSHQPPKPPVKAGTKAAQQALNKGVTETSQGFKFAGRTYPTLAQAEQAYRTLEGQSQKYFDMAASGSTSAHAWKTEAARLQAELEAKGRTDAPDGRSVESKVSSDPAAQFEEALKGVDFELVQRVANDPELGGNIGATIFVLKSLLPQLMDSIRKEFSNGLQPFHEFRSQMGTLGTVQEIATEAAKAVGTDGNLLYPEIASAEAAQVIGEIWTKLPYRDDQKWTPNAFHAAVQHYRSLVESGQLKLPDDLVPISTTPGNPEIDEMVERASRQPAAGSLTPDGRRNPTARRTVADVHSEVKRQIMGSRTTVRGKNGFDFGFSQ